MSTPYTLEENVSKSIVVISDLHCGAFGGVTPPLWQYLPGDIGEYNKLTWKMFEVMVERCKEPDLLVVNGDAIDGVAPKNGGRYMVTGDIKEQVQMATTCIARFNAKKVLMTNGSGYHVTSADGAYDFEQMVAERVGAEYAVIHTVDVNGLKIRFEHKNRGSTKTTNPSLNPNFGGMLANRLHNIHGGEGLVDVFVFSHLHRFVFAGDKRLGMQLCTPALAGRGNDQAAIKYGGSGQVGYFDFGMVRFDVTDRDDWTWRAFIRPVPPVRDVVTVV
jgi:hypothetical protein